MNATAKTFMTAVLAVASAVLTGLLLADQTEAHLLQAPAHAGMLSEASPQAPGASQVQPKPRG